MRRVAEVEGVLLDAAVAQVEGVPLGDWLRGDRIEQGDGYLCSFAPSSDQQHGPDHRDEQIAVWRYGINVYLNEWTANVGRVRGLGDIGIASAHRPFGSPVVTGSTALVAAIRAHVVSSLGKKGHLS